ncbi:MAG: hypothetical protein U9O98_09990 [Asgard group archaeon]|nr:hypothetical protein [Asgard group archaeon]
MSVKKPKEKEKSKKKEKKKTKKQPQKEKQQLQTKIKEKPEKAGKSEVKKSKTKPPREATVTISLIENPTTTEEKIQNAILRVEQLIESDVAISREDLYDLGEGVQKELQEILPEWIDKPWMYVTPHIQQQIDSWLSDWSNFILEYARINIMHIMHIGEEGSKYPFNNKSIKKGLDKEQLQQIGDYIVAQEWGIWWDKKKIRLRLYWRTLDEWADIIYEWAIKTGRAVGADRVMTIYDIQQAEQSWSTIPREDLIKIFNIMDDKGYIEWVDKKNNVIAFLF